MPEPDLALKMTEIIFDGVMPVDSYGPGFFRVGGQVIRGAILILPRSVNRWGGFDDLEGIAAAADDIDILLVGSGAEISPLPGAFRAAFDPLNIGVDVMATPAACRTFNVLLSEDRRVGLAVVTV